MKQTTPIILDFKDITEATNLLRIMNNKKCQRMMRLLANNEGLTLSQVQKQLMMRQAEVSMLISRLSKIGVVEKRRDRRFRKLYLVADRLNELSKTISAILAVDEDLPVIKEYVHV